MTSFQKQDICFFVYEFLNIFAPKNGEFSLFYGWFLLIQNYGLS